MFAWVVSEHYPPLPPFHPLWTNLSSSLYIYSIVNFFSLGGYSLLTLSIEISPGNHFKYCL